MTDKNENYDFIKTKIDNMKETYHVLRDKSDDYVFSALALKSNLYKNPSLILKENDIQNIIVDGNNDGGIDALLTDPNSDGSNLVLVQSKFYQKISFEDVCNAITKMYLFYEI